MNSLYLHTLWIAVPLALASVAGAFFILSLLSSRYRSVAYLTELLGRQYGFVRTKYQVTYAIASNGSMRSRTVEAIKAISSDVSGIEHYSRVWTGSNGVPEVFSVNSSSRVSGRQDSIEVKPKLTLNTEKQLAYQLLYFPPLKPGQSVEYSYEVSGPSGMFALSEEEVYVRKLPYDYISMKIAYPTNRFEMTILFPSEIYVEDLAFDVWLGDARLRLRKEYQRLETEGCLKIERLDRGQVVRLVVDYPILDLKYAVTWRPTSKS